MRFYWWVEDVNNFARWQVQGYWVERRTLTPGSNGNWERLTDSPVTVAPQSEWAASTDDIVQQLEPMAYNADGSRVAWEPPGLEGEELISFLNSRNQALFFVALGTMKNFEAAQLYGLAYEDASITPGNVYEYRISPVADPNAVANLGVNTATPTIMPPVVGVRGQWGDRTVELTWENNSPAYFGFDVLRREAGQTEWQRRPNGRILDVSGLKRISTFVDSLADNETVYEYAVRGRGRLGYDGPLGVSIVGQGSEVALPPTPILGVEEVDGRFELNWQFFEEADPSLVDYFTVHRSLRATGGFSLITGALPASARSYSDEIVADRVYYQVTAHRKVGVSARSTRFTVIADDTIPPPPLVGLTGEIDLDGHVTVTWPPSVAEDAIGYRVWFSNARDRPGVRVTDTMEVINEFRDTLDLTAVNDTVFYRVSALDERENIGDWSEPLALPIPDILPPGPPLLRTFTADTNGVLFTYAPSNADDVVRYDFQRRARYTDYWETFATLPPTAEISTYRDETGAEDITYEYRLVAFDEQGLRGESNILTAKRGMRKLYPGVEDLSLDARPSEMLIDLLWVHPENTLLESFTIYRAERGGTLRTYRTIAADELDRRQSRRAGEPAQWRFTDEELRRDTEYAYSVKANYRTGAESRRVPAVRVDF